MSELKPMFDNFASALGDRFWQQYPQGSIVSDLIQIHGDQYVVKVSVSLANTVLVSTLAADANLMLAEDRAREKALTILGIRDFQQPAYEPINLTAAPTPDLSTGLTSSFEQPKIALASELLPNGANLPDNLPEPAVAEIVESPIVEEAAEASPDETTMSIADPLLSVTDMIPMINMELKRLGWSKERGRDYMVALYNKRASALLSDDELFGLLQHLQAEQVV